MRFRRSPDGYNKFRERIRGIRRKGVSPSHRLLRF